MLLCRIKHTFSLTYPKGNPSRLLSLLASTVEAHSGTVEKDPQNFSLQASFQEQSALHESAGLPDRMPQESGDVKGESRHMTGPQGPATVCLSISQQPNNRPVKRQRISSAHGEEDGRRLTAFKMIMTLRQESAGSFVVLSALQQEQLQLADTAAAAAFSEKCHAIQQDVEQLLLSMQ